MKQGTAYAVRLKKAYTKFRQTAPRPRIPEQDDPLHRLAVGILGVGCSDKTAAEALKRAFTIMADWNEIRVSRPFEVHKAIGDTIPDGLRRVQNLIQAMQSVFDCENRLSLERLRSLGRREARQYLEQLAGVDAYAVASVVLWSLGGHAVPVNDKLLQALRNENLAHPGASRAEVQAFLERHVSSAQVKEFCVRMRSFPGPKHSTAKRRKSSTSAAKGKRSSS